MGSLVLTRNAGAPFLSFALERGKYVLGRSTRCDFVVRDLSVSRQHAELSVDSKGIRVRDLDSRNGTWVNEERVASGQLGAGQQVRFGSVSFILAAEDSDDPIVDSAIQTAKIHAPP